MRDKSPLHWPHPLPPSVLTALLCEHLHPIARRTTNTSVYMRCVSWASTMYGRVSARGGTQGAATSNCQAGHPRLRPVSSSTCLRCTQKCEQTAESRGAWFAEIASPPDPPADECCLRRTTFVVCPPLQLPQFEAALDQPSRPH